ncbi:hypothetical protein [Zunongwangia sp.]|uniref:hypothetical protein n=1 Tax=Zunongwangia sp. TaxID=1965325 RepID=UPI003AA9B428
MTQEVYQKAIQFAGGKYQNQKVPRTNSNYLVHISKVAMEVILAYNSANNFNLNYTIQLAILHDTLEDTETNFSELSNQLGNRSSTLQNIGQKIKL